MENPRNRSMYSWVYRKHKGMVLLDASFSRDYRVVRFDQRGFEKPESVESPLIAQQKFWLTISIDIHLNLGD